MLTPENFFDHYIDRATLLLSDLYPESRLIIQNSNQSLVDVHDDGEIILSSTTLLILVNVFFRMLTCPHILPDQGNTDQLAENFTAYPGRFPSTLEELLSSHEGSIIQPEDYVRANLAKTLADQAFDYLLCFLAAISDSELLSVNPIGNHHPGNEFSQVLLADQSALAAMFNAHEALDSLDNTDTALISKDVVDGRSRQRIRSLSFSITTQFAVVEFIPHLPVAVRIVNAQRWCQKTQNGKYAQIVQQGCNEAIIAIAEVTRQPPNLDGFNGVLNPASKKILASASQPQN
jgi:hypothetical protein